MTSREKILALFNKQIPAAPPLFSGLISVTESGLENEGLGFYETHRDAVKIGKCGSQHVSN